jgi:hypothetical protein
MCALRVILSEPVLSRRCPRISPKLSRLFIAAPPAARLSRSGRRGLQGLERAGEALPPREDAERRLLRISRSTS